MAALDQKYKSLKLLKALLFLYILIWKEFKLKEFEVAFCLHMRYGIAFQKKLIFFPFLQK
jgi:hypothetical protein